LSAASQFIGPFDILPNVLYTNPTTIPITITPIPIGNKNPTYAAELGQFIAPYDISRSNLLSPTINFGIDGYKKNTQGNIKDSKGNVLNGSSAIWNPDETVNTNISIASVGAKAAAFGLSSLGGFTGIPYTAQVGQSLTGVFGDDNLSGEFVTLAKSQLKRIPGVLYADFRSRLGLKNEAGDTSQSALSFITSKRLDGTAAAIRKSVRGGIYAGASVSPAGPYSIFNIETLYGWGEHDNPNAIRADFTLRSHVATKWKTSADFQDKAKIRNPKIKGDFIPTRNAQELATPFRGDKISVIDFGQRKLENAYDWRRTYFKGEKPLGKFINKLAGATDLTQDFIKFYFTGPKLQAGNTNDDDDIIVFRAIITTFSENFSPGWTDVAMIGRADPNYKYTGVTRDLTLDFDIYATDRDELKPIYRKLNALAGYTAPTYDLESIAMQAPWMRLTIGDLYVQTPVVMNSLGYTYDTDASWEINIENDPTMMQVPRKISVSCQFNVITDYLPQKGGRFWTLAKKFENGSAVPKAGDDNWLSDTLGNIDVTEVIERDVAGKGKRRKTKILHAK
jgi:hypothetical protein